MAIHPADRASDNPRLQCSVCGEWKRLRGTRLNEATGEPETFYRFFGGCGYTNGDHLAGNRSDVCDGCCHRECKRLAEQGAPAGREVLQKEPA